MQQAAFYSEAHHIWYYFVAIGSAAAVDVISPLEDTHWGTRCIRVQDPDGNLYVLEARKD